MKCKNHNCIHQLTPDTEESIQTNPLLNIDTFVIPSPYIRDTEIEKDFQHSYVWIEEGEILGYMLVYSDREKLNFHIYKIVTSPFGRGRGIGNSFIEHLAEQVCEQADIYLYLWEKQRDTIEYFQQKGFQVLEPVIYRNRRYYHLASSALKILERARMALSGESDPESKEDIGKTRHDARKTIRLLSHLVDTLGQANAGRIIEDINRETTTLINILNEFRDKLSSAHEINVQELILERIVPYIHNSSADCKIQLTLNTRDPMVLGYYLSHSRALINIVSNAMEAIKERGVKGLLAIELEDSEEQVILTVRDNGIGIEESLLTRNEDGIPLFVGQTSKEREVGEGLGTVQVYETFGPDHITVESRRDYGTSWTILLDRPHKGAERWFSQLERRYHEFEDLIEMHHVGGSTSRTDVIAFIWQLRKMEIFLYDVISLFGKRYNIREVYRLVLRYFQNEVTDAAFKGEIDKLKSDQQVFQRWLYGTAVMIKQQSDQLFSVINPKRYRGPLFRSYGQAVDHVIIFTLDPRNGRFFATDRKLAEHLDFVPYLGKPRDRLLRGEMIGDLNDHDRAILLGVWSVESHDDLLNKLRLLRQGAQRLLEKSVHEEKRLTFYPVTYVQYSYEIDPDISVRLGDFAEYTDEQLLGCVRKADEETSYMLPFSD
ncbi:MAG: GNAT family N-acetyltransferase [Spirochaetota bacterium]